jgi:hypothetical protein
MDKVKIVSVESRILDSIQDACTGYIVTQARPIITVFNLGTEDAEGWLTLTLVNMETGEDLAERHLAVKVSAETTAVLDSSIAFAFYSADIPPDDLEINVTTFTGHR